MRLVLFVALTCFCLGTFAQSSNTSAPGHTERPADSSHPEGDADRISIEGVQYGYGDGGTSSQASVSLETNHMLVSKNKEYSFKMQGDGNAVVYRNGEKAIWQSKTAGTCDDGKFKIQFYESDWENPSVKIGVCSFDRRFDFSSSHGYFFKREFSLQNTECRHGYGLTLVMQDDGNLVLYCERGESKVAIWESKVDSEKVVLIPEQPVYCEYPQYKKGAGYRVSEIDLKFSSSPGPDGKSRDGAYVTFYHHLSGWRDSYSKEYFIPSSVLSPFLRELQDRKMSSERVALLLQSAVAPATKGDGNWEISRCWTKAKK